MASSFIFLLEAREVQSDWSIVKYLHDAEVNKLFNFSSSEAISTSKSYC